MIPITFAGFRSALTSRGAARVADSGAALAAVALIVVANGGDLEALFIRRAEVAGDPWSGHMALPGGRWHPEDKDLMATAVRETREETGIILAPADLLGELDEYTPRVAHLPRIVVRPHVFGLASRPELKLSAEVAEHFWVSLSELQKSRQEMEFDVRDGKVKLPAYVVGQNVVWGLTERIVSHFMDLLAKLATRKSP